MADVEILPNGHLANFDDWTEDVAIMLAEKIGITMTEDHWKVIKYTRVFYENYKISPVMKLLVRGLKKEYGDKFDRAYLESLFPDGSMHQESKVAGVPEPHLDADLEQIKYMAKAKMPVPSKHFVDNFEYKGETLEVSEAGNLVDQSVWDHDLAEFLADKEGIVLTDEHWDILKFMRKFYFQFGITPMVYLLMKHLKEEFGEEKASKEHLYALFPEGPSRQGSRIAGLGEPQGCVDP
jgi:TusE/DsrC/DsvC family sulfur relay protein